MNKRNGFTLVELLAVIVILAVVLIIAVPGVLSIINKTRDNAYDRQLDMIKEAARVYVTTNDQIQWRDNQIVVNLSDLQGQGLLDQKIRNPKNKQEIKGLAVVVTKSNHKLNYSFVYSDKSNASYPVYTNAMIPIVYKENKWVKADPTNEKNTWFDYTKQQWANVATVTDDVRQTLVNAPVGTEVPMDKINTMLTWIPRFKYKLFNVDGTVSPVSNPNMLGDYLIDLQFEGIGTPKSTGTQNGQWLTHSAFTFGGEELSGFWVGKFETGYKDATTITEAESNTVNPTQIVIKPNVYSWRNSSISNMYKNTQSMKDNGNPYGITSKEEPRIIKNMEWGALVYLTQSKYGKQGNDAYTGLEKQVRINNSLQARTGCGADSQDAAAVETCNTYETKQGQAASTTGNITGIYDTSGGAWDYVGAVMKSSDGLTYIGQDSEFTQEEINQIGAEGKYFDTYEYGVDGLDRSHGKLGDATIEMGPFSGENGAWYQDRALFFGIRNTVIRSFLNRGGNGVWVSAIPETAGTTSYSNSGGGFSSNIGWRISLK